MPATSPEARERKRAYWRTYQEKRYRKTHLLRNYGMTPEEYDVLFKEQRGVCAICHKPETATRCGEVKLLAVDHDHGTGEIRGLLCADCNRGLGMFHDSVEALEAAAAYMRRDS